MIARSLVLLLIACLVAFGPTAVAEEDSAQPAAAVPTTVRAAADALIALSKANDTAEFDRIAPALPLDPWRVADEICARGATDVAARYARVASPTRRGGVLAFVEQQQETPTPAARRRALQSALIASHAGKPDESLRIVERIGAEGTDVVSIRLMTEHAFDLGRLRRYSESLAALRVLLDRVKEIDWPDREAVLLDNGARFAEAIRDYELASLYWERLAAIYRSFPDRFREGGALLGLARLHYHRGEFGKALRAVRRAVPLVAESGDNNLIGRAYSSQGVYEDAAGDIAAALSCHEEALRLLTPGRDRALVAQVMLNTGLSRNRLTDFQQSVRLLTEALEMLPEAALPVTNARDAHLETLRGRLLLTRSDARAQLQDLDAAERDVQACQEAFENAANPRMALRANGRHADILIAAKKPKEAEAKLLEALGEAERLRDLEAAGRLRLSLGTLAMDTRQLDRARESLEAALRNFQGGESLEHQAECWAALAGLEFSVVSRSSTREQKNVAWKKALKHAQLSVRTSHRVTNDLGTDETAGRSESWSPAWQIGLLSSARLDDHSAWLEMSEARTLIELAKNVGGRTALQAASVSAELMSDSIRATDDLARATSNLAKARVSGELSAIRAAARVHAEASDHSRRLQDRMERRRKLAAQLELPTPPTIEHLREQLGQGRALVLFHVCKEEKYEETRALVITHDGSRFVHLGDTATFTRHCDAIRFDGSADAKTVAAASAAILAPLELGASIRTLLVVPDGPITTVPFSLLAPDLDVAIVPSALVWTLLDRDRTLRGSGVLAIGNPDYTGTNLGPLPKSGLEAAAVGTRVLLGKEATEAAVRDLIVTSPRWRAVHFACHGVLNKRHASLSGLGLTPTDLDDGMLTAREILGLSIPADLAVLSACEAGRPGKKGEEDEYAASGIPPAFLAAGCTRVIANLWKVNDEAARVFSVALQKAWARQNITAAAALREARAAVRSDPRFKDAKHWAGWVLWGLSE